MAQIEEYRELAERITPVLSDMPKAQTNGSKVADAAIKIADLQRELQDDIIGLLELKAEIEQTIKAIDNPESQVVLELRYLAFKTWQEIADIMGYQLRNVYVIHDKALNLIKLP